MDQVMRDAGMLRLALRDRLEDRRALDLVGVGLVGGRGRGIERKRVMNLRFVVVRIALRQLLHGLRIGHDAGAMVDLVEVGVHDSQRIQIVALALGRGADALALGDHDRAVGEIFRRRGDVRVPEHAQCDAPIGDAALRDRPSTPPRIRFATRGTRTSADTACPG